MKAMAERLLVIVLAVLPVYGCAPVIPYAVNVAVPPVPAEASFLSPRQEAKRILVIPVWKSRKAYIEEGKRTGFDFIIDDAFIINASQLNELHEIIPSRTSYGVGGLSSAYSVDNYFLGMYLVADSGEAVILARANLAWVAKEKTWKAILDARLGKTWQQELVKIFRNDTMLDITRENEQSFWKATVTIPCEYFLRVTGLRKELCKADIIQYFPGESIQLRLPAEKRTAIVDFLVDIGLNQDLPAQSGWVQRDTY